MRGLEDPLKRSYIRKDLDLFKVDWVAPQETKLSSIDRYSMKQLCG